MKLSREQIEAIQADCQRRYDERQRALEKQGQDAYVRYGKQPAPVEPEKVEQ